MCQACHMLAYACGTLETPSACGPHAGPHDSPDRCEHADFGRFRACDLYCLAEVVLCERALGHRPHLRYCTAHAIATACEHAPTAAEAAPIRHGCRHGTEGVGDATHHQQPATRAPTACIGRDSLHIEAQAGLRSCCGVGVEASAVPVLHFLETDVV